MERFEIPSGKGYDSILFLQCFERSGEAVERIASSVGNVSVKRIHNKRSLYTILNSYQAHSNISIVRNLLKGPLLVVSFTNDEVVIGQLQKLVSDEKDLFLPVGAFISGYWLSIRHFKELKVQKDLPSLFYSIVAQQLMVLNFLKDSQDKDPS